MDLSTITSFFYTKNKIKQIFKGAPILQQRFFIDDTEHFVRDFNSHLAGFFLKATPRIRKLIRVSRRFQKQKRTRITDSEQ